MQIPNFPHGTVGIILDDGDFFDSYGEIASWVKLCLAVGLILGVAMERIWPILNGLFYGSGYIYTFARNAALRSVFTSLFMASLIYWGTVFLQGTECLITHLEIFLNTSLQSMDMTKLTAIHSFLTEFLRNHNFIFMVMTKLSIIMEYWAVWQTHEFLSLLDEIRDTGNRLYEIYRDIERILGITDSPIDIQDWES